jgi:uncharacterized protein YbjT (DUF2867 family)
MKIVIPGGSGQVGTVLSRAFTRDGHDVVVLSRRPAAQPWRTVVWGGGPTPRVISWRPARRNISGRGCASDEGMQATTTSIGDTE